MRPKKEELIKLQEYWYDILEKEGFQHIEKLKGSKLVLVKKASDCYRSIDCALRMIREQYFRLLGHRVHDEKTVFRDEIDKFIMTRYADGARIKTIVEELETKGAGKDRKSIRILIRRYEMQWDIKYYNRKQLNLKDE